MNKIPREKYTKEDVLKLYPKLSKYGNSRICGPCNYQPILESFGKILIQVDDQGYHGDSRVLYKLKKDKYGILFFGWGSCSGCDSLQSCESLDDIAYIMNNLYSSIKRFDLDEAIAYLNSDECKQQVGNDSECSRKFIQEAFESLTESKNNKK